MLELKKICCRMGGRKVLDDVSLELAQGHILCILGPSGCGKTTLLRIVAGLEAANSGTVVCRGRDMAGVPPHKRNFGMMFQEFALFPHQTVARNIAFGPEIQKQEPGEVARRVAQLIDIVGLAGLENRGVASLSGGERQRVALARSLAPRPDLLLLDEPMGALDRVLRDRLMMDLRRILTALDTTAIVVTHDHAEAFAVADRIAVLFNGRIVQVDAPESLYRQPVSAAVAGFLGFTNIFPGIREKGGAVRTGIGTFYVEGSRSGTPREVDLLIRPDAVSLVGHGAPATGDAACLSGRVVYRRFAGPMYRVAIALDHERVLKVDLPIGQSVPGPGEPVTIRCNPDGLVVMPRGE